VLLSAIFLALLFSYVWISPAAAKSVAKSASKAATKAGEAVVIKKKKSLIERIFLGVNAIKMKSAKVGDSKTDYAGIINVITSIITLGGIGFLGTLMHGAAVVRYKIASDKELIRVKEYKEVCGVKVLVL